ncbi:hypothetical protein KAU33_05780, partial [Candidatus Dependentiae bacterium]|nr:hypothetical protein [Candidatus Dependentiae bacterium]
DLIFFRSMKCKMKNVQEYYPCDYQYWENNGWFNKEYFFDIKINIFKKTYLKFIESRIKNQMSKSFK